MGVKGLTLQEDVRTLHNSVKEELSQNVPILKHFYLHVLGHPARDVGSFVFFISQGG